MKQLSTFFLLILSFFCGSWNAMSHVTTGTADNLAIMPSENNLNIGQISGTELFLNEGNTYIYTVDTPAGEGLTTLKISNVGSLLSQIRSKDGAEQTYTVRSSLDAVKLATDEVAEGDKLIVTSEDESRIYTIKVQRGATAGRLELVTTARTVGQNVVASGNVEVTKGMATLTKDMPASFKLNFYSGMRGPAVTVKIIIPQGINATMDNTTVNVIGRGTVPLSGLSTQSVGRFGDGYRFPKVGEAEILNNEDGTQTLVFTGLDLRAKNKQDLEITFPDASLTEAKEYGFSASYSLTLNEPEILNSGECYTWLKVIDPVTSFGRVIDRSLTYKETGDTYSRPVFTWKQPQGASSVKIMMSNNKGNSWSDVTGSCTFIEANKVQTSTLSPNKEYWFKLNITGGVNAGESNIAKFYSGKLDAKGFGIAINTDQTEKIDEAIQYLNELGGGTLYFAGGTFHMRTIHLLSNVYIYINSDATLSALKGGDKPETTYFTDTEYRSGTSATSTGPYKTPENYLSKQDVGHTYFRNCMIFAEREDNIKIIGNGTITGAGNLTTADGVMNNAADSRQDKMFVAKLCTNMEFGGLYNSNDLWYTETSDPNADRPYYIDPKTKQKLNGGDISNMLTVLRGGHFVLLATGTDGINTHDVFAGNTGGNVRDIFDYMSCSDVYAINIYAQGSSDDIVKPGSDCSLGFTRPARNYKVRNIIGDTNCNLFQIGSETADDIQDICVDNIYVLAGNKAGFSISTNDGAHVKNIHLNCGGTNLGHLYDPDHHCTGAPDESEYAMISQMRRTRAPFFISISNRGRTMGGKAKSFTFNNENGSSRTELLSTNINIGIVENIFINNIDITEVYGGSAYNKTRWTTYDGSQNKATPIIAGYKTGTDDNDNPLVNLPDGRSSADIVNVQFRNVNLLVKGTNPLSDSNIIPPELGVGKYNVSDFGTQPSYGFWFRHVKDLVMDNCSMQFEVNDDRFAMVLDDVKNASLNNIRMQKPEENYGLIQLKKVSDISFSNTSYYTSRFGTGFTPKEGEPIEIPAISSVSSVLEVYPDISTSNNTQITITDDQGMVTSIDNNTRKIEVATGAKLLDLLEKIISIDGSIQDYRVMRGEVILQEENILQSNDILIVTSASGTATNSYTISIVEDMRIKIQEGAVYVLSVNDGEIRVFLGTTVLQLKNEIVAFSGNNLYFNVSRQSGMLVTGDKLTVTAGNQSVQYTIRTVEYPKMLKIEGETADYSISNLAMTTKTNNETTASNGANRQFDGGSIGDYVDYIIPNVPVGTYTLEYTYKRNSPGRGIVRLSVNGTDVGGQIDEYGASGYITESIPDIVISQSGDAIIRTTITGKNALATNYTFVVDFIELSGELPENPDPEPEDPAKGLPEGTQATNNWHSDPSYYDISWFDADNVQPEYTFTTAAELAGLSYLVNGRSGSNTNESKLRNKIFKLDADIDLSSHYWIPIGQGTNSFGGWFDGQGHTITGLYINYSDNSYAYTNTLANIHQGAANVATGNMAGLFGRVNNQTAGAYIKNIVLGKGLIKTHPSCFTSGALIAFINCSTGNLTVSNVINAGVEIIGGSHIGGLIGYANAAVKHKNLANWAPVTVTYTPNASNVNNLSEIMVYGGGIIGAANTVADLNNSYNTATINVTSASSNIHTGGLIGAIGSTTTPLASVAVTNLTGLSNYYAGNDNYMDLGNNSLINYFTGSAKAFASEMKTAAFVMELNVGNSDEPWITKGDFPVFGTTQIPTVNQQINAGVFKTYVKNGVVYISGLQTNSPIEIYNLIGRIVWRGKASQTEFQLTLSQGIYIIKTSEGQQKIVIH